MLTEALAASQLPESSEAFTYRWTQGLTLSDPPSTCDTAQTGRRRKHAVRRDMIGFAYQHQVFPRAVLAGRSRRRRPKLKKKGSHCWEHRGPNGDVSHMTRASFLQGMTSVWARAASPASMIRQGSCVWALQVTSVHLWSGLQSHTVRQKSSSLGVASNDSARQADAGCTTAVNGQMSPHRVAHLVEHRIR